MSNTGVTMTGLLLPQSLSNFEFYEPNIIKSDPSEKMIVAEEFIKSSLLCKTYDLNSLALSKQIFFLFWR